MKLDHEAVLQFLPHRAPFLFIDSIEEIKYIEAKVPDEKYASKDFIGTEVTAKFTVKPELEVLAGHFPGRPILPGVVQVEMMAQTSCFTIYHNYRNAGANSYEVALVSTDNAKFRRPVVPGMVLDIKTKCVRGRATMFGFTAEIFCEGESISQADLLASMRGL